MDESKFHLKVTSREGVIFEGNVESLNNLFKAGKSSNVHGKRGPKEAPASLSEVEDPQKDLSRLSLRCQI